MTGARAAGWATGCALLFVATVATVATMATGPTAWAKGKARTKAKAPPPYVDTAAGFQLTLPAGWEQVTLPVGEGAGPLVTFAADATDQLLVVTRIDGPTDGAYAGEQGFYDRIEAGAEQQTAGYKRISAKPRNVARAKATKKAATKQPVPGFDLWFRMEREGQVVTVGARYLFFKGYALSIVIDSPTKKTDAAAKKIVESFVPTSSN